MRQKSLPTSFYRNNNKVNNSNSNSSNRKCASLDEEVINFIKINNKKFVYVKNSCTRNIAFSQRGNYIRILNDQNKSCWEQKLTELKLVKKTDKQFGLQLLFKTKNSCQVESKEIIIELHSKEQQNQVYNSIQAIRIELIAAEEKEKIQLEKEQFFELDFESISISSTGISRSKPIGL
eukprot:Pgem_evm1s627